MSRPMESASRRVLAGAVLMLVGAAFLLYGLYGCQRALRSSYWSKTRGTIISSELDRGKTGRTRTYTARIRYVYEVDGRRYEGDRISFADPSHFIRAQANAEVRRYSPGLKVDVYYRAGEPDNAVLEAGLGWGNLWDLLMSLGLAVVGWFVLPWDARERVVFWKS